MSGISGAFGLFGGTIGAIDGWLCALEATSDVPDPSDYFSGHYQCHGLNVQVVCDANLQIIHLSMAGVGQTNNAWAFCTLTKLQEWLSSLEDYFIVGDNAYPLLKSLLIPFSGADSHDNYNDSYNFHLSQLRIRVEICFGRLTTKWQIFRSKLLLAHGTPKNCQIVRVGAALHNYVINADNLNFRDIADNDLDTLKVEPTVE